MLEASTLLCLGIHPSRYFVWSYNFFSAPTLTAVYELNLCTYLLIYYTWISLFCSISAVLWTKQEHTNNITHHYQCSHCMLQCIWSGQHSLNQVSYNGRSQVLYNYNNMTMWPLVCKKPLWLSLLVTLAPLGKNQSPKTDPIPVYCSHWISHWLCDKCSHSL